jgi:hypothetical protein
MIIDLQEKVAHLTLDKQENNLDGLIPITKDKALRLLYPCEVICLNQCEGQFTKGKTYIATGYTSYLNIERDDANSTINGWRCEFFALPKIKDKPVNIVVELTPVEAGAIMSAGRSKR